MSAFLPSVRTFSIESLDHFKQMVTQVVDEVLAEGGFFCERKFLAKMPNGTMAHCPMFHGAKRYGELDKLSAGFARKLLAARKPPYLPRKRRRKMDIRKGRLVASDEVARHIDATNPHHGSRDAWAGMPVDWRELRWYHLVVPLSALPPVEPASKRDVRSYAKRPGRYPAVVLTVQGNRIDIADGAHRIAAARSRGDNDIDVYAGKR